MFGSVLREDYETEINVDVFVQFKTGARKSFITLARIRRELEKILKQPVDWVPQDGLQPVIREEILSYAEEIYAT